MRLYNDGIERQPRMTRSGRTHARSLFSWRKGGSSKGVVRSNDLVGHPSIVYRVSVGSASYRPLGFVPESYHTRDSQIIKYTTIAW